MVRQFHSASGCRALAARRPRCGGPDRRSAIGNRQSPRSAFTLVEILIVVVILGTLAAIVIPQFSNASHIARENVLKDDLRFLRTQIMVFKAQHRDVPPGYPGGNVSATPTAADFVAQMTLFTDELCGTSTTRTGGFVYGPYLSHFPQNPVNGLSTVMVVPNGSPMPEPDGTTGWIYKPQTTEIIANLAGADSDGTPYVEY